LAKTLTLIIASRYSRRDEASEASSSDTAFTRCQFGANRITLPPASSKRRPRSPEWLRGSVKTASESVIGQSVKSISANIHVVHAMHLSAAAAAGHVTFTTPRDPHR